MSELKFHGKAIISDCSKYRYELHREWDKNKGKVLFIMLNPSTADHVEDDLTTRRCIKYAERWGYGGIMIGNLFPFRAKRPKDLRKWLKDGETYQFFNRDAVHQMAEQADIVVCAWGCNYKEGIPEWIEELDTPLYYLELCKDGKTPKHPLGNLSKDLEPKEIPVQYLCW